MGMEEHRVPVKDSDHVTIRIFHHEGRGGVDVVVIPENTARPEGMDGKTAGGTVAEGDAVSVADVGKPQDADIIVRIPIVGDSSYVFARVNEATWKRLDGMLLIGIPNQNPPGNDECAPAPDQPAVDEFADTPSAAAARDLAEEIVTQAQPDPSQNPYTERVKRQRATFAIELAKEQSIRRSLMNARDAEAGLTEELQATCARCRAAEHNYLTALKDAIRNDCPVS